MKDGFAERLQKFLATGFQEAASELCIIQGAFPLADLNAMLETTGQLGRFLKRLQTQQQVSADAAPDEQQGQLAPMRERAQG